MFEMIKFRGGTEKYFVVDFGYPRPSEIDFYQVMWNGHYINYFETSRLYFCKHIEMTTEVFDRYGIQVPVYSYNVQMRNAVLANQKIRVAVRPVSFKKGLLELFHVLIADDEIKAVGTIIHAVIETKTRAIPSPMPEVVNNIIEKMFEPFAPAPKDHKPLFD